MQKSRQALLKYLSDNNVPLKEAKDVLMNPEVAKELKNYLPSGYYERIVAVIETLQQETQTQVTPNVDVTLSSIPRVRLLPLNK